MTDDAIVRPRRPGSWPEPPEFAIMVGSPSDLNKTVSKAGLTQKHSHVFLNSRLYFDPDSPVPVGIVGPFIGAPYAAILLETLIAWGIQKVLFFGWCGSIHPDVAIGDIFVPTVGLVADGTSPHYLPSQTGDLESASSQVLHPRIISECRKMGLAFHEGPVWTTDAAFRETTELIERYRGRGALAVEMEAAALFAIGGFRGIDVSAVLAVSDELHTPNWRPGFKTPRFRESRNKITNLLFSTISNLQDMHS